jgi:hypothetical protein
VTDSDQPRWWNDPVLSDLGRFYSELRERLGHEDYRLVGSSEVKRERFAYSPGVDDTTPPIPTDGGDGGLIDGVG